MVVLKDHGGCGVERGEDEKGEGEIDERSGAFVGEPIEDAEKMVDAVVVYELAV